MFKEGENNKRKLGTRALTFKLNDELLLKSKRSTPALTSIINLKSSPMSKRSQVTIFIIIGIVIIAIVGIVLIFSNSSKKAQDLPRSLESVYESFLTCLEGESSSGIGLLLDQGGYIDLPEFEPGSFYSPFSSQLDFVGTDIPYWYYMSGSNIQKEQVPGRSEMERQLADFVSGRIGRCNFDEYYIQGFSIKEGVSSASAIIRDGEVEINLNMDLSLSNDEDRTIIKNHRLVLRSNLGSMYDSALEVYKKQQQEMFLEKYGLDILGLYAPMEGVELSCSPLIWNADEVFKNLENAIETNTLALRTEGDKSNYFVVKGIGANARFINLRNWTHSYEVNPTEGPIMMSTPVGNQPGLGILGFCYVDYHFVYNLMYPVVIQIVEGDETFQFPVAVVIKGNRAREPLSAKAESVEIPDFCKYKNTAYEIKTYNIDGRSIDADISYECSNTNCYIGKTENGVLNANFPQCVNGRILARANGYEDGKATVSILNYGSSSIYLDKITQFNVSLKLDGRMYTKGAMISFISNGTSSTIFYPDQKSISLSEGEYEVQVQIYKNSTLKLGPSVTQQCVDVPRGVIGGILGLTRKKCFDVEIPDQIISNALSGGGKQNYYISSSQINKFKSIEINAQSLPNPDSLEQLQLNYLLYEDKSLEIVFR